MHAVITEMLIKQPDNHNLKYFLSLLSDMKVVDINITLTEYETQPITSIWKFSIYDKPMKNNETDTDCALYQFSVESVSSKFSLLNGELDVTKEGLLAKDMQDIINKLE